MLLIDVRVINKYKKFSNKSDIYSLNTGNRLQTDFKSVELKDVANRFQRAEGLHVND